MSAGSAGDPQGWASPERRGVLFVGVESGKDVLRREASRTTNLGYCNSTSGMQPVQPFGEEMMGSSTDTQKSTEAFARRAELEAERDAIVKARLQAEADSIDVKTMRLRALRMAQERRGPGPIDRI